MDERRNELYEVIKGRSIDEVTGTILDFLKEHPDYPRKEIFYGFEIYCREKGITNFGLAGRLTNSIKFSGEIEERIVRGYN